MHDAMHGNAVSYRAFGSTVHGHDPGRVFKGKKMAGQMGNSQATEECLEILRVDNERNLLLVKGAIPGSKNGFVRVFLSDKKNKINSEISKQLSEQQVSPVEEVEETLVEAVVEDVATDIEQNQDKETEA